MDPMELGQRVRIIDGDHPHALPTPLSYVYVVRLDSIDESGPDAHVNQEQIEPID